MQLNVAHISDTHQNPGLFMGLAFLVADVIILTGDVLDNVGRIDGTIQWGREARKQDHWARKMAKRWAQVIGDRPVVLVCGNHDFISPAKWLRHYGVEVHEITDSTPCVEVKGVKFAGFRQVEWIAGEWAGEVHDLAPHVERALATNPDVLVTHCPPAGILDGPNGYGCRALTSALCYSEHHIKAHFYGHCHEAGGASTTEMGIYFANWAEHCLAHTIEI